MSDPTTTKLLGGALARLGALWLHLGDDGPELPQEAEEAALRASAGYQDARRRVSDLLAGLDQGEVHDLEAAINRMTAEALDVGWKLGIGGRG